MKKGILAGALGLMAVCLLIALAPAWLKATPHQFRLFSCVHPITRGNVRCPSGSRHQFLLANAGGEADQYKGVFRLYQAGRLLASYPFSSKSAQPCNWLDGEGLPQAVILTWKGRPAPDSLMRPGQTYQCVMQFAGNPPRGAALWLSWLSRG